MSPSLSAPLRGGDAVHDLLVDRDAHGGREAPVALEGRAWRRARRMNASTSSSISEVDMPGLDRGRAGGPSTSARMWPAAPHEPDLARRLEHDHRGAVRGRRRGCAAPIVVHGALARPRGRAGRARGSSRAAAPSAGRRRRAGGARSPRCRRRAGRARRRTVAHARPRCGGADTRWKAVPHCRHTRRPVSRRSSSGSATRRSRRRASSAWPRSLQQRVERLGLGDRCAGSRRG